MRYLNIIRWKDGPRPGVSAKASYQNQAAPFNTGGIMCPSQTLPTTPAPSSFHIPIRRHDPNIWKSTASSFYNVQGPPWTFSTETTSPLPKSPIYEPAAILPLLFAIVQAPERSQGILQFPHARMALGAIGRSTSTLGARDPSKEGSMNSTKVVGTSRRPQQCWAWYSHAFRIDNK